MKILGIDYGLKRIGLALAEEGLAEPLMVISYSSKGQLLDKQSSVVSKIANVCQKQAIEKIVIGMPEGKIMAKVFQFGQKITQATKLPVEYQNETLTSQEAVVKMIQAGKKRKYRQTKSDAIAAALILQNYLDKLKE